MYRSFVALLLGTLRLLLTVIGGVGGVTDVGHPYPDESDADADRRWREEGERKRRRQTKAATDAPSGRWPNSPPRPWPSPWNGQAGR